VWVDAPQVALLDWMIGPDFLLRAEVRSVRTLQWRFRALGMLSLVVLPFVLPFLALYFAFRHVEEFQAKKEYLGPRKWSPRAHWVLREFNELPHVQLRRMGGSLDAANLYCRQFPSHLLAAVAKCVSYVCGAVVSVCLGLALVNDDLLVTVTLGDKNLLWVTAVSTAVLATARAFVFDPEERMLNPNGAMAMVSGLGPNAVVRVVCLTAARGGFLWCACGQLVPFTHYMPSKWRGRCHTYDVQDQFQALFPYRAKLFVQVGCAMDGLSASVGRACMHTGRQHGVRLVMAGNPGCGAGALDLWVPHAPGGQEHCALSASRDRGGPQAWGGVCVLHV
jgi:autophagy-related protein 9